MIFKNTKIQKLIYSLVIIATLAPSLILFAKPRQVEADVFTGIDPANIPLQVPQVGTNATTAGATVASAGTQASGLGIATKTWYGQILDQLLMAIAKKALQTITKSVISWINSGFHGSPLFLENPQSFFTDIAKTEIKTLVNQFGYDPNKFPFGQAWALNTINSYKRTLDQNASYSLNGAMTATQATNFRNNFNVGGWNGFLINTQYPQNNYLGFNMLATDQLARQLQGYSQTAAQKVQTTLQQGAGFLSPQTCSTNPNYNNMTNEFQKPEYTSSAVFDPPYVSGGGLNSEGDNIPTDPGEQATYDRYVATYNTNRAAEKAAFNSPTGSTNCPNKADGSSGLINTTPGSVVSSQIMGSLSAGKDATVLGTALGTGLSAIFDALLNHFLDKGLNALASTINPAPVADTWTYGGQSLNINGNTSSVWNGPDEEIILDKFKKQISGETDWTAQEGALISEAGDTRTGTCSNLIDSVGTCSTIKDSSGNLLPVSKMKCDTSNGTWIVNSLSDITVIPKAQCIAKKGNWDSSKPKPDPLSECSTQNGSCWTQTDGKTYVGGKTTRVAVAGETISEVGDTTGGDPAKGTYIPGDIANTQTELVLMDSFDSSDPMNAQNRPNGIIQSIGEIILNTQTLDKCLPGPDKGWEARLTQEENRITQKILQQNGDNNDDLKVRAINDLVRELKFAVTSFKDWVSTKMMLSLPSAVLDIDAIQSINDSPQQLTETTASKRTKVKTLALLRATEATLAPITTQPDPGSAQEKIMINLKKQYNAIQADISSTNTIESTRATLTTLNQQLNKILDLIPVCKTERSVKGWGMADGSGRGSDININFAGITFTMTRFNVNTGDSGLTAMLKNIFSGGIAGFFGGGHSATINPTQTQYTTSGTELEQFCGMPIMLGYSHGDVIRSDSSNGNYGGSGLYPIGPPSQYTFRNRDAERGTIIPVGATGKDIIFDYTGLPMVNAEQVYGDITCSGTCSLPGSGVGPSDDTTSINIDCPTVWKSNTLDYTHAGDLTQ